MYKLGIFSGKIYLSSEFRSINECCTVVDNKDSKKDIEELFKLKHKECLKCYTQGFVNNTLTCLGKTYKYSENTKVQYPIKK